MQTIFFYQARFKNFTINAACKSMLTEVLLSAVNKYQDHKIVLCIMLLNWDWFITVNGTSGEGMSMNVKERKLVTEAWVKAVETTNQHLMVQVGGAPLPDVIELVSFKNNMITLFSPSSS